jgi:phospholipase C
MPAGLDQLKHIVVVMLENRSFDHMVGYLQSQSYNILGVDGTQSNPAADGSGRLVHVSPDARTSGDLKTDPGHAFIHTNRQIFGNEDATGDPTMQGFIADYYNQCGDLNIANNIMKCFSETTVPVISMLAKQYAICDHWFSSVPGPTIPNRMFAQGATSLGSVVQDPLLAGLKTIYEVMDSDPAGNDYRIYHYGFQSILVSVDYLSSVQDVVFRSFDDFKGDCASGDLPAYTFIEACYSDVTINGTYYPANSQHPNYDVAEGERFLLSIYNSIRSNETLWERTVLLIVYDEHGGIYDHLTPPRLDPPFVQASDNPPFNFDRLGIRVPAVLVSPFIEAGTIDSTVYEHSSIVAAVRKRFAPNSPPLTPRDAAAAATATFIEKNLTRDTARQDVINFNEPAMPLAHFSLAAAAEEPPSELAVVMANGINRMLQKKGLSVSKPIEQLQTAHDYSNFMLSAGQQLHRLAAQARKDS